MLKDVAGIRVCGANFENPSNILFFDPHSGNKIKKVSGSLIYGRNGAGKSTLAKAIKKAKDEFQETSIQADFVDLNNSTLELSSDDKSHIFVFDEEYVDKNVKFQESGLSTIVMLGHQVELAEKIQTEQKNLEALKAAYDAQEVVVKTFEKSDSEIPPMYHVKKMRWALQGDDCWAGRDKLIKGNRQNTAVHSDTYKQFIALPTSKTRDQLIVEFNETLKSLREAQQGDAAILDAVSTINICYNEEEILRLLKTKIEKPKLSEREHYLLELAQTGNATQLNNMIAVFSDKNVCTCPMCMQSVSKEYKQDLVQSVQKVLSKTVEDHQASLCKFIISEIEFDLSPFMKLANTDLCSKLLLELNNAIKYNNLVIQSKIDDPYTPCEQQLHAVSNLLIELNDALDKLECERIEYNKEIADTKPIVERLTKINNQIAHFDIQDSYLRYLASAAQAKKEQEKFVELQNNFAQTKRCLDELEATQRNVRVAVSIINKNLNYIFFSPTRFKIDYQNGNYVLLSNGKVLRPSQISQGERNIIGLCYFFASILQNQEESIGYTKEYLLVIDDPISSFDIENKTGIMSFLRYQLGKFLFGNKDTRAIIMTHDLPTYYDLEKVFKELTTKSEKIYSEKTFYHSYELRNQKLIAVSSCKRQEYSELVKIVYNYALGDATEYELVIGNIMRQMLEAFSTFQYKKGIGDISTDQSILALLPENIYQTYFENLMYRLILNNGSHRLEQTQSMSDMYFFTVISDSEKRRTAKEILCFVYLLNKKHLLSHLEGCADIENNLQHWCADIKKSCLE